MKRIVRFSIFALAASAIAAMLYAGETPSEAVREKPDGDGHVLSSLWKEYEKAAASDRPQKAEQALDNIIVQAKGKRHSFDFLDALRKWYSVCVSRDWKRRAECLERVGTLAAEYDDPAVTYNLVNAGLSDTALDMEWYERNVAGKSASLKRSQNPGIWRSDSNVSAFPEFISGGISCDYEYLLWALASGRNYRADESAVRAARKDLEDWLKGTYPAGAYFEYLGISSFSDAPADEKHAAFEKFAEKYEGKAVALFASQRLLADRKNALDTREAEGGEPATEQEYIALRNDIAAFEKLRGSFSGKEKEIASCCSAEYLTDILDAEEIRLYADGQDIEMVLRNVESVSLTLKNSGDGKAVLQTSLGNPSKRYYVTDTLRYTLPSSLGDGDYTLGCKSRNAQAVSEVSKHRISVAFRTDADGTGIYAADFMSGEPVGKADIEIFSKGSSVFVAKDFVFNGFTPMRDILSRLRKEYSGAMELKCSYTGTDGGYRSSGNVYVPSDLPVAGAEADRASAVILKDRSAFVPGDTVKFKTVAYSRHGADWSVFPAGRQLSVSLYGADNDKVASAQLVTNGYGSAAGEFALPEKTKGGRFRITVSDGNVILGSSYLTVDEFVLPSYRLEFDRDTLLRYPGDTVTVSGRLVAYSGHSVSAAKLSYEVFSYGNKGNTAISGNASCKSDGTFSFSFPTDGQYGRNYYVTVRSVDLNGETLEWSSSYRTDPGVDFSVVLKNAADASVVSGKEQIYTEHRSEYYSVLGGDTAQFSFSVKSFGASGSFSVPAAIEYSLGKDGNVLFSGRLKGEGEVSFDLTGRPSGLYVLETEASLRRPDGRGFTKKCRYNILKTSFGDTLIDSGVEFFTKKFHDGDRIAVQIGTSAGDEWLVAELYDGQARRLDARLIHIAGRDGRTAVTTVGYEYLPEYPDEVRIQIFGFRNGGARRASYDFVRKSPVSESLPLEIASFTDMAYPRGKCSVVLRTAPDAECALAVFDASTEKIAGNMWPRLYRYGGNPFRSVSVSSYPGRIHVRGMFRDVLVRGSVLQSAMTKSNSAGVAGDSFATADSGVFDDAVEESAAEAVAADDFASSVPDDVLVRDKFDNTIAFMPFLHPDASGRISAGFTAADKLSSYVVQVYAHDKKMNDAMLRCGMLVTMPLKVSAACPQYLYSGDSYRLKATVSNASAIPVSGIMKLQIYHTEDYISSVPVSEESVRIAVGAGESAAGEFSVSVPAFSSASGFPACGTLGFKIVYAAESDDAVISDGMFVSVPVYPAVQTITEAHSALLRPGADRDSLVRALAAEFTGTLGQTYDYGEISLMEMIERSIPEKVSPASEDVLSLADACYAGELAAELRRRSGAAASGDTAALFAKILACRNADGGFSWFEGFASSPMLTVVVAERLAGIARLNHEYGKTAESVLSHALRYLDGRMTASDRHFRYDGVSLSQYLKVRSLYPEVGFTPEADSKTVSALRKEIRKYLSASGVRSGSILERARRASVALNLSGKNASSLASALRAPSRKKLLRLAENDIESLIEYAVDHPSGGKYYPNAVMPVKGLLENEIYAHVLICGVLGQYASAAPGTPAAVRAQNVADGIRLWLMVQKETGKWDTDPAFMDALACVFDAPENLKKTVVAVVSKRYEKPFAEIAAAGNGFTVERRFYRADNARAGNEISEGEAVAAGDKVIAEYRIWSGENRTFVKLSAPRYAALRPVQQLSGRTGGWLRTVSYGGMSGASSGKAPGTFSFAPAAYREVKADRTNWYIDLCPEEYTVLTEEFFVSQTGTFTAPAVTIESLYAPHYRANDAFPGLLHAE